MLRFLSLFLLLTLCALPAYANPIQKGLTSAGSLAEAIERGQFSAAERHIIRTGLLQKNSGGGNSSGRLAVPQGMAKKQARGKPLPPGWQKRVVPGKRLDYQVYRSGTPLPGETLKRLPPAPVGTELLRIENSIVRLQASTHIVIDSFDLLQR